LTAIVNVELSQPLTAIPTPSAARRCLLILRWRGRVVGRTSVRTVNGEVTATHLANAIRAARTPEVVDGWLDDLIGHDTRHVLGTATPTVSVVICTRERPADLARALDAVRSLQPPPLETIVVDNAPTSDATREVVARAEFAKYVREDRRGLDAARNRALREARGDIVAFTDDDAVPEPGWLQGLLPNFADRVVAVTTGLTLPLELATEGQELFEEHCTFVRGFTRRVFDGQRHNPLAVGQVGAGANMAVRRDLVLSLGGFDERLDGGMPTRSGGDHDLFTRVLLAGHRIVYDPAAVSWHRHRRTTDELLDTVYGYGVGVYAMWTGLLIERREVGILRLAWQWLTRWQLPALWRRGDPFARAVARRELQGCLRGPASWFAARRLQRRAV
jgi:glycosyltransferase involved in cell wall biosynthesis